MSARQATLAATVAGAGLVLASRWLIPAAPALYDGIQVTSPEPYHYASPPPDLTAGNKPAVGVDADLKFVNGANLNNPIQTPDSQLLVFFTDGAIKVSGVSRLHVHIQALTQPPPAPARTTYVGNVYEVVVTDFQGPAPSIPPGALALPPQPAITSVQALMRVPPTAFNDIRLYYDGAWHEAGNNWSAQGDFVAISPLTHLGLIAAFDDIKKPAVKPKAPFPVALVEVGLTVIALGIIAAGILVQLRRQRR